MNLKLGHTQKLALHQWLSPKLIQTFKLFHSSYTDLLSDIQTQLEENPALEIIREDRLRKESSDTRDSQAIAPGVSLTDHLLTQLFLERLSEKEQAIVEALITHLDPKGYLPDYPSVRDQLCTQFGISERKVHDCLVILQSFEPTGVGARDLKECLLLQLEHSELRHPELEALVRKTIQHHLEDLAEKKEAQIAKKLGINEDGVLAIAAFIRETLDPNPAREFGPSNSRQITPSFEVKIEGDALSFINLEQTKGIQLGLSSNYEALLKKPDLDPQSKKFLEEKLEKGKQFLAILEQRHQTLSRLMAHLLVSQRSFFLQGEAFLHPHLQKEVSQALGISASTISRLVSNKYVQTPFGIFLLKHLCPRNHFGKTATQFQSMIQALLEQHPDKSDLQLAQLLQEQGYTLARRTLAKYREKLKIKNSYTRKK